MKKLFYLLVLFCSTLTLNAETNLVSNGNFANGLTDWNIVYKQSADQSVYTFTPVEGDLSITTGSTKPSDRVDLNQSIELESGCKYTLSFDYKANINKLRIWCCCKSENGSVVYFGTDSSKDSLRTLNSYFPVASDWTHRSVNFTYPTADSIACFWYEFRLYKNTNIEAHLRNVSLVKQGTTTNLLNTSVPVKSDKVVKDNQFIIYNGDRKYNILGQQVK